MSINVWIVKYSDARLESDYKYLPMLSINWILPRSQTHIECRDGFNVFDGQCLVQATLREIGRRDYALVTWTDKNEICIKVRIQSRNAGIESVLKRELQHGKDNGKCDSRDGG